MGIIRRLDDDVINKIAAGEVVERPASVLKELLENALDAGADDIRIELEEGGIKRLTVIDNGQGMNRDDAKMCVVRHATSKIQDAEDLFNVASMGFRGEALAAIASVSDFTLQTCAQGETQGTVIRSQPDLAPTVDDWRGAKGTRVTVEDLFGAVPARRSFLKTPGTEFSHCLELVQAVSMQAVHVGFTLLHQNKECFRVEAQAAGSEDRLGETVLRARVAKVVPPDLAEALVYIDKTDKFGTVEGFVSPPGLEKSTSKHLWMFVNGRWVKDKTLRYAIMRGYHSHLLKGRYPVVVLSFRCDPTLVDVNVHPSKTEVRFQYQREVQDLVAVAIREGLRQGAWSAPTALDRPASTPQPLNFSSSSELWVPPRPAAGRISVSMGAPVASKGQGDAYRPTLPPVDGTAPEGVSETDTGTEQELIPWSELTFLGAFAKCYLFFEWRDRLLVVDQHAFHERVLYERLLRDKSMLGAQQKLLMPEALTMAPASVAKLREQETELTNLGFAYDYVDDTTVEVTSVPALLMDRDLNELFAALAEDEAIPNDSLEGIAQNRLATLACHAAVRAGEELPDNELNHLLAEAHTVDFYHNCPHGRRVFRWYRESQVASWFDR